MKIKVFAAVVALICACQANAQQSGVGDTGNVTIYGVLDSMVRYTTNEENADGAVGSKVKMGQGGALQGSRLGFTGQENLGNDLTALFRLEMGFMNSTGASDQQGQLFGRQAYVGLKHAKWGELDAGRQYGVAFDTLSTYDPVGMGNMPENVWQLTLMGVRFDNTLKYTNTWGAVKAEVQYSPGGQAGTESVGTTSGLALNYAAGPLAVGVVGQQSVDASARRMRLAGAGASYNIEATSLFLNYFSTTRDPGFQKAANNSGGALANTSLLGNADNLLTRKDDVVTLGVQVKSSPALTYTVGYMIDAVTNESSAGNSGRIATVYGVTDYHLSKRTSVYLGLDYTKVSGGEIDDGANTNTILQFVGAPLGGKPTRTGVAVGLRTAF